MKTNEEIIEQYSATDIYDRITLSKTTERYKDVQGWIVSTIVRIGEKNKSQQDMTEAQCHFAKEVFDRGWEQAYEQGVEDQKTIDIDKACKWWEDYLDYPTNDKEDKERIKEMIEEFKKAMEE